MTERDLITYPTWERYTVLSHYIFGLSIRERRNIFHLARHNEAIIDQVFFPRLGLTFTEFAVWYTLGESRRKGRRK